jgi:integrase
MPRKVKEVSLNNRTARAKLAASGKPYFRLLGEGLHLGYRKPATPGRAGAWVGRWRRQDGVYATQNLAAADDLPAVPVDGVAVMTFEQAQAAVRAWAKEAANAERAAIESGTGVPKVRDAVTAYVAGRTKRAAKSGADAEMRLHRHVLTKPLAETPLHKLTERTLADWRAGLEVGGRKRKDTPARPLAPASEARLLNDLRAALTAAAQRYRLELAHVIRAGLKAPEAPDEARPRQIVSDADVRRIVTAARTVCPDFGALVMLLAATGARFDQVARITVADFQPDHGRIMVPTSKKGRSTKPKPFIAVPLLADMVAALRPLVAGRTGAERLLTRWHNVKVTPTAANGHATWKRDGRRGWMDSSEVTRPWKLMLAEAKLQGSGLVPYCLRHSSIVRGLNAGLPVRLVAALHDTSTAMIEKHYSAFIVDASEELLRRAMIPMASAEVTHLPVAGAMRVA